MRGSLMYDWSWRSAAHCSGVARSDGDTDCEPSEAEGDGVFAAPPVAAPEPPAPPVESPGAAGVPPAGAGWTAWTPSESGVVPFAPGVAETPVASPGVPVFDPGEPGATGVPGAPGAPAADAEAPVWSDGAGVAVLGSADAAGTAVAGLAALSP